MSENKITICPKCKEEIEREYRGTGRTYCSDCYRDYLRWISKANKKVYLTEVAYR